MAPARAAQESSERAQALLVSMGKLHLAGCAGEHFLQKNTTGAKSKSQDKSISSVSRNFL